MGDGVACSLPFVHSMVDPRRSLLDPASQMLHEADVTMATTNKLRPPASSSYLGIDSNVTPYDRRSSVTSSDDATLGADAVSADAELAAEFARKSPGQADRGGAHLQQHHHQLQQQNYAEDLEEEDGDDDVDDDDRSHIPSYDSAGNKLSPKYYHCRMCNKEFESKSEMQRHSKEMHRSEEKGHKCLKCLKTFPSSQQLAQHSLVHTNVRKYPCKYCDKSFKQLSHVQQHQRIHTGERPYRCSVDGCSKSFRQLSSLQQHLKGHSGLSSFKNYQVARSPTLAAQANKNREKINTTLARPHDFTCQVCEKMCEDEIHFYRHIHQHHPDYWRVFSGGQPLADFINDNDDLKQEPEESTFYCQRCRMEFPNEFGYWKHLSLFHPPGDVPQPFVPDKFSSFLPQVTDPANPGRDLPLFACPICKKLFTKQSYLVRHIELKTDPDHRSALENLIEKSNSINSDQSPHDYEADVARMTMSSLSSSSSSRNHGDHNRFERSGSNSGGRHGFNFSAASISSNEDQPIVVDDSEEKKEEKNRRRSTPQHHDFYEPFYPKFTPRPVFNFFPPPPPPHDQQRGCYDDNNGAYDRPSSQQQPYEADAPDPMKAAEYRKPNDYANFYHDSANFARPNFSSILRLPYPGCSRQQPADNNSLFGCDQRSGRLSSNRPPTSPDDKFESLGKRPFMAFR